MSRTSTVTPHIVAREAEGRGRRRLPRNIIGLLAAGGLFALIAVGGLSVLLAIPLMGLCLAWVAPPEREGRQVLFTPGNAVVGVVAIAGFLVVALLPVETVFLLSVLGPDRSLLLVALAAAMSVSAPLALRESPPNALPPARLVISRRNVLLAWTGLVSLALAHSTSSSFIALLAVALVFPVPLGLRRVWLARRGSVETGLWRHPLARPNRRYLVQAGNHWLLLGLVAATVPTGAYDPLRGDLSGAGYGLLLAAFFTGLGLLAVLATLPLRGVRPATNALVLVAAMFLAGQVLLVYRTPVNPVAVEAPVSGEWYVVQGGRSELVNGHNTAVAQDYALDIVKVVDRESHQGPANDLTSYYAWGEPLRAPASGVVTAVVDRYPDQRIGSVDLDHPAGNQVVLAVGAHRYLAFGHLQSGSTTVSVGDRVETGDLIASVGNSGNSDEPHLHVQAQNKATFDVLRPPEGLTNYPLVFAYLEVRRHGAEAQPAWADLRRGDSFTRLN